MLRVSYVIGVCPYCGRMPGPNQHCVCSQSVLIISNKLGEEVKREYYQ